MQASLSSVGGKVGEKMSDLNQTLDRIKNTRPLGSNIVGEKPDTSESAFEVYRRLRLKKASLSCLQGSSSIKFFMLL